jgi:hypothetical protein
VKENKEQPKAKEIQIKRIQKLSAITPTVFVFFLRCTSVSAVVDHYLLVNPKKDEIVKSKIRLFWLIGILNPN